jgi:ribosomal protein S12 methylthiotransferase
MSRQQGISLEINRKWVGKSLPVLIEDYREKWSIGRSFRDAPEIDGLVMFPEKLLPGSLVTGMVTKAQPYDLIATSKSGTGDEKQSPKVQETPFRSPKNPQ